MSRHFKSSFLGELWVFYQESLMNEPAYYLSNEGKIVRCQAPALHDFLKCPKIVHVLNQLHILHFGHHYRTFSPYLVKTHLNPYPIYST